MKIYAIAAFFLAALQIQSVTFASDFRMDLSSFDVGSSPSELGSGLIVTDTQGLMCVSKSPNSEDNFGTVSFKSLNLSSEFEVLINADFNGRFFGGDFGNLTQKITLISQTSELRVVFSGDEVRFGGTNDQVPLRDTNWESGETINYLKLTVESGSAKFYINDVIFQTIALENPNAVYHTLNITGLDIDDFICAVRGGNSGDANTSTPVSNCTAQYTLQGELIIPCLAVPNALGGTSLYEIKLDQRPDSFTFDLNFDSVVPK